MKLQFLHADAEVFAGTRSAEGIEEVDRIFRRVAVAAQTPEPGDPYVRAAARARVALAFVERAEEDMWRALDALERAREEREQWITIATACAIQADELRQTSPWVGEGGRDGGGREG